MRLLLEQEQNRLAYPLPARPKAKPGIQRDLAHGLRGHIAQVPLPPLPNPASLDQQIHSPQSLVNILAAHPKQFFERANPLPHLRSKGSKLSSARPLMRRLLLRPSFRERPKRKRRKLRAPRTCRTANLGSSHRRGNPPTKASISGNAGWNTNSKCVAIRDKQRVRQPVRAKIGFNF